MSDRNTAGGGGGRVAPAAISPIFTNTISEAVRLCLPRDAFCERSGPARGIDCAGPPGGRLRAVVRPGSTSPIRSR
jgi:hypothetical protein